MNNTILLAHEHSFWLWLFECRALEDMALSATRDAETIRDGFSGPFAWDEAFVSPCCMNETNRGGFTGTWTPEMKLIGLQPDGRLD